MKYIFTTISYGDKYYQMAHELAEDMARIDKELLIFTDKPSRFNDLDNVILLEEDVTFQPLCTTSCASKIVLIFI